MRDIGPAADSGEAVGERLDVAAHIVEPRDLGGEPFVGNVTAFADVAEQAADHSAWCIGPTLRKSGSPHTAHSRRAWTPLLAAIAGSSAISLRTARSIASGAGRSIGSSRLLLKARDQRADVGEIEIGIAPIDPVERPEAMVLDRRDLLVGKAAAVLAEAERSERTVLLVAAGAAGDLRHFGDGQPAVAAAVELLEASEGDMADVHVEAHADRVGGDQIIDLAALEHRDLRIAGRGRERAHDHGGAAAEAPKHLGERVDLLGGEGDDGGARRKARQLDAAGIAQRRKARPSDDLGVGQQLADDRPKRVRAEDQRLLAAAGAQHAVGEDMAALGIDAELRLVDRGEGEVALQIAVVMRCRRPAQACFRRCTGNSAPGAGRCVPRR